jgi:hypothetical protein
MVCVCVVYDCNPDVNQSNATDEVAIELQIERPDRFTQKFATACVHRQFKFPHLESGEGQAVQSSRRKSTSRHIYEVTPSSIICETSQLTHGGVSLYLDESLIGIYYLLFLLMYKPRGVCMIPVKPGLQLLYFSFLKENKVYRNTTSRWDPQPGHI